MRIYDGERLLLRHQFVTLRHKVGDLLVHRFDLLIHLRKLRIYIGLRFGDGDKLHDIHAVVYGLHLDGLRLLGRGHGRKKKGKEEKDVFHV